MKNNFDPLNVLIVLFTSLTMAIFPIYLFLAVSWPIGVNVLLSLYWCVSLGIVLATILAARNDKHFKPYKKVLIRLCYGVVASSVGMMAFNFL